MTRPAPRLIGISGRARSGKSTFAQALVEHDGYEEVSFAEPIRQMLLAQNPQIPCRLLDGTLPLSGVVHLHGWEKAKDLYPEIRRLLQTLGTDAGRAVLGEDVWVDAAMRAVDRKVAEWAGKVGVPLPDRPRCVFPDVRFQNEFDAIKARGGIVVRVERGEKRDGDPHESENSIDDAEFDYVIHNDGSVSDLRQKAFDVVAKEMGTFRWEPPEVPSEQLASNGSLGTYVWPAPPKPRCVIVPRDVRVFRSKYDLAYFAASGQSCFPGRVAWFDEGVEPNTRYYPELFESNDVQATDNVTENGYRYSPNGSSSRDFR